MVTPKFDNTCLEFDRPVFNNILSQKKLGEYGHAVMENHGNYVYKKINMVRTIVNMESAYNKNIDVGCHPIEWFSAVFPVLKYQQIPDKFLSLKKMCYGLIERGRMQGRVKREDLIQIHMISLWSNFNVFMLFIQSNGLILIQM